MVAVPRSGPGGRAAQPCPAPASAAPRPGAPAARRTLGSPPVSCARAARQRARGRMRKGRCLAGGPGTQGQSRGQVLRMMQRRRRVRQRGQSWRVCQAGRPTESGLRQRVWRCPPPCAWPVRAPGAPRPAGAPTLPQTHSQPRRALLAGRLPIYWKPLHRMSTSYQALCWSASAITWDKAPRKMSSSTPHQITLCAQRA